MSITRRSSVQVSVGAIRVGGGAPIVVQSMTNTDTADVEGTAGQVQALARAGSELVRITVNTSEAAAEVATIRETLARARKEPAHPAQRRPRHKARPAIRENDGSPLPL